ncbi:UbiX family flavin prenyltransferase [Nocardioides hungaricus]
MGTASETRRVVVALTGATGALYGLRALELLRDVSEIETHVIVTKGARATIRTELDRSGAEVSALADVVHSDGNLGASIASGSFRAHGMLIAPCSVKTLSGIANAYADNLVVRAADVMLKERRRLVLMVRETPLHLGHLRLMMAATHAGAIVMPPVPALYSKPGSVQELVDFTVVRALDLLDIEVGAIRRWTGMGPAAQVALAPEER